MAILHFAVKSISRGKGHSATGAAAYRAGLAIDDPTTGERHDYTRRQGVVAVDMLAPEGAPAWATDPHQVWARVEANETRKNARVGREIVIALPHELDPDARRALAREVGQMLVDRYQVAAQVAIHAPDKGGDDRNHHTHILFTPRQVDAEGFGAYAAKAYDDFKAGPVEIKAMRAAVSDRINQALARAGIDARTDPRTLAEQKAEAAERGDFKAAAQLDRLPTQHEGKATTQARRRGERVPRARRNDRRQQANARRLEAHEARFQQAKDEAQAAGRLVPVDEQALHARALLERTQEGRARFARAATPSPNQSPTHGQHFPRPQQRAQATAIGRDNLHLVRVSADSGARGRFAMPAVRPLDHSSAIGRPGRGHAQGLGQIAPVAGHLLRSNASGPDRPSSPLQRLRAQRGAAGPVARTPAARSSSTGGGVPTGNGKVERLEELRATIQAAASMEQAIAALLKSAAQHLQRPEALTPWQRATARGVLETWEQVNQQQRTNQQTAAKEKKARDLRRRAEADANQATFPRGRLAEARRAMGLPSAQDQAAAQAQEALTKARARVVSYKTRGQDGRLAFEALQRDAEKARADFAQAFNLPVPRFDQPPKEAPQLAPTPNRPQPFQRPDPDAPRPSNPAFRR